MSTIERLAELLQEVRSNIGFAVALPNDGMVSRSQRKRLLGDSRVICNTALDAIAQAHAEYAELERRNAELVEANKTIRNALARLKRICGCGHPDCGWCADAAIIDAAVAHSVQEKSE